MAQNLFPDAVILLLCACLIFAVATLMMRVRSLESEKRHGAERLEREKEGVTVDSFRRSVALLADRLDCLEKLPTLVDGMAALCRVQSQSLDQLTKAVGLLEKSLNPAENADEYEQVAAGMQRNEEREIEDLLKANRGLDREGATGRVRERRIYEQLGKSRG
jgi:hypothetical protein